MGQESVWKSLTGIKGIRVGLASAYTGCLPAASKGMNGKSLVWSKEVRTPNILFSEALMLITFSVSTT